MATYYASPSGSDSNNGTSTGTPFATLAKFASLAVAGDVLQMRAGSYPTALTITRSGTSTSPITVQNYPGETATIVGYINCGNGSGSAATTGPYWKFQSDDDNYRLRFDGSGLPTGSGNYPVIGVYGNGCKFLGIEAFASTSNGHSVFDIGFGGVAPDGLEIGWCKIHSVGQAGQGIYHHGVYAGEVWNAYIHDNYIWDCSGTGVQAGPGCNSAVVRNNTIDGTGLAGVVLWSDPSYGAIPPTYNCDVHHNLITNGTGYSLEDFHSGQQAGSGNNKFRDNYLFNNSGGFGIAQPAGASFSNNITNGGDPLYTNRAGHVYTLAGGSPAAGYGVSSLKSGGAPPTAPVSSITEGATLSGTVTWTASGIQAGAQSVKFWADNVMLQAISNPGTSVSYSLNTRAYADGAHIVGIGWTDASGNSYPASPPTNVTIDNSAVPVALGGQVNVAVTVNANLTVSPGATPIKAVWVTDPTYAAIPPPTVRGQHVEDLGNNQFGGPVHWDGTKWVRS